MSQHVAKRVSRLLIGLISAALLGGLIWFFLTVWKPGGPGVHDVLYRFYPSNAMLFAESDLSPHLQERSLSFLSRFLSRYCGNPPLSPSRGELSSSGVNSVHNSYPEFQKFMPFKSFLSPFLESRARYLSLFKPHFSIGCWQESHGEPKNTHETASPTTASRTVWLTLIPLADPKLSLQQIFRRSQIPSGGTANPLETYQPLQLKGYPPYLFDPAHQSLLAVVDGNLLLSNDTQGLMKAYSLFHQHFGHVYENPQFSAGIKHLPVQRLGTLLIRNDRIREMDLSRLLPAHYRSWSEKTAQVLSMTAVSLDESPDKFKGRVIHSSFYIVLNSKKLSLPRYQWIGRLLSIPPQSLENSGKLPADTAAYLSIANLDYLLSGLLREDQTLQRKTRFTTLRALAETLNINLESDIFHLFSGETVFGLRQFPKDLSSHISPISWPWLNWPWIILLQKTPEKEKAFLKIDQLLALNLLPLRQKNDEILDIPVKTLALKGKELHFTYGGIHSSLFAFSPTRDFEAILKAQRDKTLQLSQNPSYQALSQGIPSFSHLKIYSRFDQLKRYTPIGDKIPLAGFLLAMTSSDNNHLQGEINIALRH